jgi:fibro-slime domain-containing protein
LPPTIVVPVTFYDFRSDRSNPEFEQPHQGGRRRGMVANQLDADNKPQLGPTPYRNFGIAHWFRDWNTYTGSGPNFFGRGSTMAPCYSPTPGIRQLGTNEWNATVTGGSPCNVGHDTSFKNIVIPGQLEFRLVPGRNDGMYEFSRRGTTPFFPLDGRGFGNEWNYVCANQSNPNHASCHRNFAFTMEMEFQFQVRAGMIFNFEGDDDVWVFINNSLVLDIGGIHEPIADSFTLSPTLLASLGLVPGQFATLRVFYAERHSEGSNIWIQTNIVAPPASINVSTSGNRQDNSGPGLIRDGVVEKSADDRLTLYSVVYDDNGLIMNPGDYDCNHVEWRINGMVAGVGCELVVADSIAGALNITVTYNNRRDPPVTRNIVMNVRALLPYSLHVQTQHAPLPSAGVGAVYSQDVYFGADEQTMVVYAVLRDRYGNFAGYADAVQRGSDNNWWSEGAAWWQSEDLQVATVSPANGMSTTVRKEFMGEGTDAELMVSYRVCRVIGGATECVTLADTVRVGSRSEGMVAVGPNPFIPGQTSVHQTLPPRTIDFYGPAINNSGAGNGLGVLIAVDSPKPLQPAPGAPAGANGGRAFGRIVIYDAVGNVVRRDYLYGTSRSTSYGYVWDGKNERGRTVGPGTYLVRVTGRDSEGTTFAVQRKIGVTK